MISFFSSICSGKPGTTPEYISRTKQLTKDLPVVEQNTEKKRVLCSERRTVPIDLDGRFFIVGERINPTGKKLLQAQLREGNFDNQPVHNDILSGKPQGISPLQHSLNNLFLFLHVNMGMSGIDEKAVMLRAVEEVSGVTNLPLSLDSSHVDVMEMALRRYPGRALINSISGEEEMSPVLPRKT